MARRSRNPYWSTGRGAAAGITHRLVGADQAEPFEHRQIGWGGAPGWKVEGRDTGDPLLGARGARRLAIV